MGSNLDYVPEQRVVLIVGNYGKGRVAVFAGTPMGVPPKGQTPFWTWAGWPRLMKQTADWLAGKGGAG